MKKRVLSLLLVLMMVLCLLPTAVLAEGEPLEVGSGEVTSVKLNKNELTLLVGDSETLIATVDPAEAASNTVYSISQDTEVIAVGNDGTITAKKGGTATVIATNGEISDSCTVMVNEPVEITVNVTISKDGSIVTGKGNQPVANVPVKLSGKAAYTIDDALKAVHTSCYVGENGYATADSQYGFSLTKLWGDTSGKFGYQVIDANGTIDSVMGLSHTLTDGDSIDAYINQSTYPDNEGHAVFDKRTASVTVGSSLELGLTYVTSYDTETYAPIYEACADATLTIDGAASTDSENTEVKTDENGKAILTFGTPGIYVVSATKTKTVSEATVTAITAPVCVVTVTYPDAAITVPTGADLFVGSKLKHFVPFTEVQAITSKENSDNTTTYYYDLKNNSTYNYRISGDTYVTYAGAFKKTADYALTVTEAQLNPDGKTASTIDCDVSGNSGYNVADIYLNINPQGYLKLAQDATYQIVNLRNWEAVDSTTNNYFIEPDYHYTVLEEDGSGGNESVISINDKGLITAKGAGTAIVLVTYDAINIASALGGPFFGAIWPENTGVFVVSVGAEDSGIITGMTLNAGKNNAELKLSGDAIDAEHDVIYFTGETGSYTFTPGTEGCTVSVASPTVGDSMTFSGFKTDGVIAKDDAVTVPLVQGRNIVKIEKDGKAEYQVITAKKLGVTVNGKALSEASVAPGEALTITLSGLYHPANKLAGVYNMTATAFWREVSAYAGRIVGSSSGQYNFASKDNSLVGLKENATMFGTNYKKDSSFTLAVPADYAQDTFVLSGGELFVTGFGDSYGNHRGITLTEGKAPNMNASVKNAVLGQLPDISIPIATLSKIEVTTQPTKTEYKVGDSFDPEGMEITATYSNGASAKVTGYTVDTETVSAVQTKVTVTYTQAGVTKTADVTITVRERALSSIAITTVPTKTTYTQGEYFDPTGMKVTAAYDDSTTADITNAVTYTNNNFTEAGSKTVTISYTEKGVTKTVTQAVTVNAASAPSVPESSITVKFTLLGDSRHGDGEVHTLKDGNLTTWLDETNITVPAGSKVIDVIIKALGQAGIPYTNPDGNYVTSVKGLTEMDNGSLSGWMYTRNGTHSTLGVSEQTVRQGDVIVFHYTDDYTVEQGSDIWNDPPSTPSTPSQPDKDTAEVGTLAPEAATAKGESKAVVSGSDISAAITEAAKDDTIDSIVIAPEVKGEAGKVSVELPKTAAADVANKELALTVKTGIADITIPADTLTELSKKSGSTVTVAVETRDDGSVAVEVKVGSIVIDEIDGGLKVTVPAANENSNNVLVLVDENGKETIIKKSVASGKEIAALIDGSCTIKVVDNSKTFTDGDHWAGDAISFVSSRELFNGVGDAVFAPELSMSRAMLATVLHRLEDTAAAQSSIVFPDVTGGTWYSDGVAWANGAGIVKGYPDGSFGTEDDITRQDLAVMLWRYAKVIGMDTGVVGKLDSYGDSGEIGDWADEAMEWAVGTGIITGKPGGILDPTGSASRAEVATMLQRLVKLMLQ